MSDKNDAIVEFAFRAYVNRESAKDSLHLARLAYTRFYMQAEEAGVLDQLEDLIGEWNDRNG